MADEKRRRHNRLSGTLGASLGSAVGDTTITFAAALQEAGSNIATLASDEHLVIIIDDEILYLTDYTAGATTGTVARGQEGTSRVAHSNGAAWFCGPTERDFVKFKKTTYKNSSDYTVATSTLTDIDATNLPALSVYCFVGDIVELKLHCTARNSTDGQVVGFDWLIDQPTSADTSIRAVHSADHGAYYTQRGAGYDTMVDVTRTFTVTEEGVHSFKPQWKNTGGTATIPQAASHDTPITHVVKNLGPETAAV